MDLLHIHLLLNHVPVIGTIGCALLLIAAFVTRSRDVAVAGLVTMVLVSLVALPVFFTGEPAEERVENLAGLNKGAIETHEEAALPALIAIEVGGALALLALIVVRFRPHSSELALAATVCVALVATILVARAANLGGEIRHTELGGAAAEAGGGGGGEDD